MTTTKVPIEIDDDLLEAARKELGTKTKKDTVNAALRFIAERQGRVARLLAAANPEGTFAQQLGPETDEDNPYVGLGVGADITDPEVMKLARR